MPTLTITKAYADGDILLESDLDSIRSDITTWANTTKLDSDNLQNDGVQATKIDCDESTIDGTGTSLKVKDDGITNVQVANSVSMIGEVKCFHSFNGTLSIPRGWMQLNGDVVNETNYNAIHGAGSYTADNVSASDVDGLNLPNMNDKYPVGAATTTQDGTSPITYTGNASNQVDIEHNHQWYDAQAATESDHSYDNTGSAIDITASNPPKTPSGGDDYFIKAAWEGTVGDNTYGLTGDWFTNNAGSTTQDIQPESCEFIYIMRVV